MKFEHKLVISKFGHSGRIKENKEIYNKYYKDKFDSISEFMYCYLHQDTFEKDQICPVCGNKIKFDNKNCKYPKHCSRRCAQLDPEVRKKYIQACLEKYGKEYFTQTQEYRDKSIQACLNKYGKEYYSQTQECKDKVKCVCLEKYGKESYTQTQEYRDKVKLKLDATIQKIKQTKLIVDSSGLNSYQRGVLKGKKTCSEKYGVDSFTKTPEYKQQVPLMKQKEYATKKANNSFNKSEQEDKVYKLLLTKFSEDDIERQYWSELYPFHCDFYIKSLDLYIEYNGHWTHGKEPFDKNNPEHIKILDVYKSKNTKFFRTAIRVWTDLDVRKLETFKKNKLNYKIFYTMKEFNEWFVKVKMVK